MSTCSKCHKPVIFADQVDENGARMGVSQILDAAPPVYVFDAKSMTCRRSIERYVSHFATCSHANTFTGGPTIRRRLELVESVAKAAAALLRELDLADPAQNRTWGEPRPPREVLRAALETARKAYAEKAPAIAGVAEPQLFSGGGGGGGT